MRISNGELRIFTETAKRSNEDIGDDVAEGVVALALADAVAFAQSVMGDVVSHVDLFAAPVIRGDVAL